MVIYIDVRTRRDLSAKILNAQLEVLGSKGTFTYKGKRKRGEYTKHFWHHKRYAGGIEFGEVPDNRLIYASAKGATDEERLASSWIEWIIRYFHKKIERIEVIPEYVKVAK
jgi:hypothetical protein